MSKPKFSEKELVEWMNCAKHFLKIREWWNDGWDGANLKEIRRILHEYFKGQKGQHL
jgi:hypothetical protein